MTIYTSMRTYDCYISSLKGGWSPHDREIPLRIEVPRNTSRNPERDAQEQVGMTIIKRESAAVGHFPVCSARVTDGRSNGSEGMSTKSEATMGCGRVNCSGENDEHHNGRL